MAEEKAVWGIDIGQAGLKAIRLRYAEASGQTIAVAFDYVPHPKILSQPDAVPDDLIRQALLTFLSRNETRGDLMAISVPGQSALARFIQLPPVESSKVVEIVKYEARQQIPFALEEVIWDFQTLGSGSEEGGYLLEAEVGLFAMKRDQVLQQLRPFNEARCEVELIQIAPLALYNFLCYDQLGMRLDNPDSQVPGQYNIVLDMGTDNTTLLVSNGAKIWIRNVPIGGNHFTRALTKEMKLTFAKAEHLKCNATKSHDPKAVFQALRPVFNDYVSEIQRSIGYFSSVNRDAKIQRILGLGNGFKLAGLQKFLHQNLQYEVERVETFPGVVGDAVLSVPLFQENILTFAVPYGLALQGLKLTRIHTSLLPREIETARMIRRKKPWAIAGAAVLLVGLATSAVETSIAKHSTAEKLWAKAEEDAKKAKTESEAKKGDYEKAVAANAAVRKKGQQLLITEPARKYWLEVYKAINESLPIDETPEDRESFDITQKHRLRIQSITVERTDLGKWFNSLPVEAKELMDPDDKKTAPSGQGYVFTLQGLHLHADPKEQEMNGELYVKNTLLRNLNRWEFRHEKPEEEESELEDPLPPVPIRKIGITHSTVVGFKKGDWEVKPNPRDPDAPKPAVVQNAPPVKKTKSKSSSAKTTAAKPAGESEGDEQKPQVVKRTDFIVAFAWKETPEADRKDSDPRAKAAPGGESKTEPGKSDGTKAEPGKAAPPGATPPAKTTPGAGPATTATPPTVTPPANSAAKPGGK